MDMVDGGSVRTHYSNCPVFNFMISIEKRWMELEEETLYIFSSSNF